MLKDINNSAYALLGGGWTPDDKEEIKREYKLTEDETTEIIAEMIRIVEERR